MINEEANCKGGEYDDEKPGIFLFITDEFDDTDDDDREGNHNILCYYYLKCLRIYKLTHLERKLS